MGRHRAHVGGQTCTVMSQGLELVRQMDYCSQLIRSLSQVKERLAEKILT